MNSSAEAWCSPAMSPVLIEMVPSSRIASSISAFMSNSLSEQELVLGLHRLLPAQFEGGVIHNFPAVLHAQFVDHGDVGRAARRFVLHECGDQIAPTIPHFAAIGEDADLQSQNSSGLLQESQVPRLKIQRDGVHGIARH